MELKELIKQLRGYKLLGADTVVAVVNNNHVDTLDVTDIDVSSDGLVIRIHIAERKTGG